MEYVSARQNLVLRWNGRFFRRSFRKSVAHKPDVKKQLDDIEDQRPFFTYWITTVQVLILVISLACYGFGPFGFELNHRSGLVSTYDADFSLLFSVIYSIIFFLLLISFL